MSEPAPDSLTPSEIIQEFYNAIEMFEGDRKDFHTVQKGIADHGFSEEECTSWRDRLEFNESQLQRSGDRLLELTNAMRVLAEGKGLRCVLLEKVSRTLLRKPYERLPLTLPSEEDLEAVRDDAERVKAACAIDPRFLRSIRLSDGVIQADENWVSVSVAAKTVSVEKSTITKWCDKGLIRSTGRGRDRRVDLNSLAEKKRQLDQKRL